MMKTYACGSNVCGQIIPDGPKILCCPSHVQCLSGIKVVHISVNHILWRNDREWSLTGHRGDKGYLEAKLNPKWKVCTSERRTAGITPDGSVVVWEGGTWRTLHFQPKGIQLEVTGSNEDESEIEQGCQSKDEATLSSREISVPYCSQTVFKEVYVEHNHLIALGEDGVVYTNGIPHDLGRMRISQVAVGKEHSVAVSTEGAVLTWGSGMRGQLGHGELCPIEEPTVVESLLGVTISSVHCGGWHTVALSTSGDAYVWGWNESGQLGFPTKASDRPILGLFEHICQCLRAETIVSDVDKESSPEVVFKSSCEKDDDVSDNQKEKDSTSKTDKRLGTSWSKTIVNVQACPKLLDFWSEDVYICNVECGDRHTLFQLDDGSVWAAGMNKYGQLGLGHLNVVNEPTEVPIKNVSTIFAGGWNSVFRTDAENS